MLRLNQPIGVGLFSTFSVKSNINMDREQVLRFIKEKKIELDQEALEYLRKDRAKGVLDYGPRSIDFFPSGYVIDNIRRPKEFVYLEDL